MDYLGMLKGETRLAISEDFDYVRKTRDFVGLRLFPIARTENMKLAIMELLEGHDVPVMALVHALDTEADFADRPNYTEFKYELLLVKRKINQGEALRKKLKDAGMSNDEASIVRAVYNDAMNLISQVLTRFEVMALEAMCTGKLKIRENNVSLDIDYNIPENHRLVVSGWSDPAHSILNDLMKIRKNSMNKIVRAYTSDKIMGYILANTELKNVAKDLKEYLTEDFAKSFIASKFGIEFVSVNEQYKLSHQSDIMYNAFDENTVVFATTNGTLGNTFVTSTPTDDVMVDVNKSKNGYVSIRQWFDNAVGQVYTQAEGLGLPVFKDTKVIYICTVSA